MSEAIGMALDNIDENGGPFGAVITFGGKVIAQAANSVTRDNDPTAHAEVNAIRLAAKHLGTFDLSGCTLYTSCEPCPMCLGAIYWARIGTIYYSATRQDAREAGFNDDFIYTELDLPAEERSVKQHNINRERASEVFGKWAAKTDKTPY